MQKEQIVPEKEMLDVSMVLLMELGGAFFLGWIAYWPENVLEKNTVKLM